MCVGGYKNFCKIIPYLPKNMYVMYVHILYIPISKEIKINWNEMEIR